MTNSYSCHPGTQSTIPKVREKANLSTSYEEWGWQLKSRKSHWRGCSGKQEFDPKHVQCPQPGSSSHLSEPPLPNADWQFKLRQLLGFEKSVWSRIRKWEPNNSAIFLTESKASSKLMTKSGKVRNNGKKEKQALLWGPTPAKTHPSTFQICRSHLRNIFWFNLKILPPPNGLCALQICCSNFYKHIDLSFPLFILYRRILQLYQ